ncbi:hypothetical protein [Streptomyces sp. NPDC055060]
MPDAGPGGLFDSGLEEQNRLLGPDGWTFRAFEFLSGRPIYTPFPTPATGPMVSLPLANDGTGKLDLVLGHTYSLLDREGEQVARDLLRPAVLTLRCDGGIYHPMPGDGWTVDTYEVVLNVDRVLLPAFTKAVTDATGSDSNPCSPGSSAKMFSLSWSKAT